MDYWNHTDFQLAAHPGRDIAIITGADDIITSLEESLVTLTNIRGSRFVTPIKVSVGYFTHLQLLVKWWMNGQIDGWMDKSKRWVDEWMNEWIIIHSFIQFINEQRDKWTADEWFNGRTDGQIKKWTGKQ